MAAGSGGARFERDPQARGPVVNGFAGTGYRVGETIFPRGLLLTPDTAQDWDAPPLDHVDAGALAAILGIDPQPEFILLGTGNAMLRPPRALSDALIRRGIGLEPMDSRAAARAWGMLRGEGRWIAAALLPLG